MRKLPGLLLLSIMTFSLVGFQNCSNVKFEASEKTSAEGIVGGDIVPEPDPQPVCNEIFVDQTRPVKVLFVIDKSGSNLSSAIDKAGTDPMKTWRSAVLKTFADKYKAKPNLSYSVISFNNGKSADHSAGFVPSLDDAIASFNAAKDTGNTPYKAGLTRALTILEEDEKNNSSGEKPAYMVVFMSDGYPSDYGGTGSSNTNIDMTLMATDISKILSVATGRVALSTVYYYNTAMVSAASTVLEQMSQIGGGTFAVANSGSEIDVQDTIKIPQTICQ